MRLLLAGVAVIYGLLAIWHYSQAAPVSGLLDHVVMILFGIAAESYPKGGSKWDW